MKFKFLNSVNFWSYILPISLIAVLILILADKNIKEQRAQQQVQADYKVSITAGMVKQTSEGAKTADRLFDGDTKTPWFAGWNKNYYPQRAVIDLGASLPISRIRLYDGTGTPQVRIFGMESEGDPGEALAVLNLEQYDRWREVSVNPGKKAFRFLAIMVDDAQGDRQLTEMEVYTFEGHTVQPDTTKTPPIIHATGAAEKINLCGFHWVPLDKLRQFKFLRIYVATNWVWQKNGLYVEPMYQAGSPAVPGFDTYLAAAKAQGLEVMPCINQTPAWYRQGWFTGQQAKAQKAQAPEAYSAKTSIRKSAINGKAQTAEAASGDLGDDFPPVKPGSDRTSPKAYADFAGFWGQFIMRYGSVKHPLNKLRVDKTPRWSGDIPNEQKTGLGLVKFVEVWNEPDKWWKLGGAESAIYMQPQEYAAMLWACYDSIKAADPAVQVVMAGLTGFDLKYLTAMEAYYKANGVLFKADVLNVHHYSNNGNQLGQWPPTWNEAGAVCPETDKDFPGIAPLVKFAHERGKPIWVTEFGSDSRAPSWMFAAPFAGFNSEQLQAQWLARTYLEYIRYGVDNAFMFNAIDEPGAANGGLYQNSGLMLGQSAPVKFANKQAYVTISNLIRDLKDAVYLADLSTPQVRIMAFRVGGNVRLFYWSPTMSGANTVFKIGSNTLTATEWPQTIDIQ